MTFPTVNVTVKLVAQDGTPYVGVVVRAKLDQNDIYQGFVISADVDATTDNTGTAVLALFPNAPAPTGLGTTGSIYKFSAQLQGGKSMRVTAQVPNTDCSLDTIADLDAQAGLTEAQAAENAAQAYAAAASNSAAEAATNSTAAVVALQGVPGGIASLDSNAKVPTSQMPPGFLSPVTSVAGKSGDVTLVPSDVGAVAANVAITGATKTKITYDAKGLVTAGADATTADVADSTNRRYVTDAQSTVITGIAALTPSNDDVLQRKAGAWTNRTIAQLKTDLSLGNVDNTSDANKPVSTAQAAADAGVLATAEAYADGLVVGLWDDRGNFNASGNAWPTTGGSGAAGAIKKGDTWTISVTGTLGGQIVDVGDVIRALADAAGSTNSNWAIQEHNLGYTAENSANRDTSGGYAGLTLLKINFWNALGTFKSFFTNANTAARTYTFQDRNGTVADDTDIAGRVPTSRTVNGHGLSGDVTVSASDVGLSSVTNDVQTKAAVVPNTAPSAGQVLVGNAGGTAYAPATVSGDATLAADGTLTLAATVPKKAANNVFTKSQTVTPSALVSGASIAVDASASNNFKLVLATNATLQNPTNLTDGMVLNFRIKQDSTGSRTLAYGTKFKFAGGSAPVLSTAANAVDFMSCYYDATDDVLACSMIKGLA